MIPPALDQTLAELPQLDRPALQARYRALLGREPPPRASEFLLRLAIAYRLQAQVFGDLKPAIRTQLLKPASEAARVTNPGTVLIREWHGQHHTVTVNANHFLYRDRRYRSLSEIARTITGQQRSGPVFFGLKRRRSDDGAGKTAP